MHDRSEPAAPPPPPAPPTPAPPTETGGIGFALFLLLAGLILLAERLGWISQGLDWLFPVILLAWGAAELYRHLRPR